jgi:hypothetical protein
MVELTDDVVKDKEGRDKKALVIKNVRTGLIVGGIAQALQPLAGLLFGLASGILGGALAGGGSAALMAAATNPLFLIIASIAAVTLITSVAVNYVTAKIGQSNCYDMLEINAERTAAHLVKSLAKEQAGKTQEPGSNERWTERIRDKEGWVEQNRSLH